MALFDRLNSKDGSEMSFIDHLEVLRGTIVRSAAAILIMALMIFIKRDWIMDNVITGPIQPDFITYRLFCEFSHWAGLHYVLGAFLAGMITPKSAVKWNEGMDFQQMYWLMPVFFIWTGLKTQWTMDFGTILLGALGMFVIAIVTKFIGVWLAYRDQGLRVVCLKTSLLQTKGLMEIFLVMMLLTAGIVSVNTFAAVVIMSLISTIVAVPLAQIFYRPEIDNK